MRVKLTPFLLIGLLFIASCASEVQPDLIPKVYIIEEPKTFVIEGNNAWIQETNEDRHNLNTIRAIRDYEDDLEEFRARNKLRNVIRVYDGELIKGYDEEVDKRDLKKVYG
jgi:hypothetical protein